MRTLPELQTAFSAALLDERARDVERLILADGLTPAARVQVYRNHVLSSLTEALETTFPVVCRLVDRRFFGFAADRYIRAYPPSGPCLFEYGESFGDFLSAFPPCAGHPYLADVARLEWAMSRALHAEDVPAMAPETLATVLAQDVGQLVFRLEPSASWLQSPWPIDRIWRANQPDADPDAAVDLAAGSTALEIRRRDDTVALRGLDPAAFAFRGALGRGLTLEIAANAALAEDPAFDLATAFRALLDEALLTGFTLPPGVPREGESR
jgi:hypothetical protein